MTNFTTCAQDWDDHAIIYITSPSDQAIGSFPLDFVRRGGDNSWTYVLKVVLQLVEGEGRISTAAGEEVNLTHEPQAGTYYFIPADRSAFVQFATGPEYFRKNAAPILEGSESTRSNSRRSTVNQSQFRTSLIARDYCCLISDADYEVCTACHIVPQSRPDVYGEIFSVPPAFTPPMFRPSCGLLLEDAIHHAFDRLEVSLHIERDVYYIHFFILKLPGARHLHGKALTSERFRGPKKNFPDPKLLEWHYNQCVKARIRGFDIGLQLPATSALAMR